MKRMNVNEGRSDKRVYMWVKEINVNEGECEEKDECK